MTKTRNVLLVFALALTGAVSAFAAVENAAEEVQVSPSHCREAFYAWPKGPSRAFYRTAQCSAASVAISKVAALVEEYKLVASQSKGKKKTDPESEPTPEPEPPATGIYA